MIDLLYAISKSLNLNESLGNHLHLEIYQSGVNIDPLKIIGKNFGELCKL